MSMDLSVSVAVDEPAIRVESLYKGFGGPPVLRGLVLEVAWGGALVIFGANGSGKTTLLRLLATLYKPDRGSISLAGLETRRSAASIRRLIGVVGHQPMLYQNMTCEENLTFFGRMYGLENVGGRVDGVLTQMGLEARRLQRVRTLSHGMQKRLAMARAVLHDPPILLMDEPESGLDQGALEGMESLREMSSGCCRTVVVATHNVEWGLGWGESVAVLRGGSIAYEAPRDELDDVEFRKAYGKLGQ